LYADLGPNYCFFDISEKNSGDGDMQAYRIATFYLFVVFAVT
jgi:hypothetical protein